MLPNEELRLGSELDLPPSYYLDCTPARIPARRAEQEVIEEWPVVGLAGFPPGKLRSPAQILVSIKIYLGSIDPGVFARFELSQEPFAQLFFRRRIFLV